MFRGVVCRSKPRGRSAASLTHVHHVVIHAVDRHHLQEAVGPVVPHGVLLQVHVVLVEGAKKLERRPWGEGDTVKLFVTFRFTQKSADSCLLMQINAFVL